MERRGGRCPIVNGHELLMTMKLGSKKMERLIIHPCKRKWNKKTFYLPCPTRRWVIHSKHADYCKLANVCNWDVFGPSLGLECIVIVDHNTVFSLSHHIGSHHQCNEITSWGCVDILAQNWNYHFGNLIVQCINGHIIVVPS